MFQCALPVLLFGECPTTLDIYGKTDEPKSLGVDYTKSILLPFLRRYFGISCTLEVRRRSLSREHLGHLVMNLDPVGDTLEPISLLERGEIISFTCVIWSTSIHHETVQLECLSMNAHSSYVRLWQNQSNMNSICGTSNPR